MPIVAETGHATLSDQGGRNQIPARLEALRQLSRLLSCCLLPIRQNSERTKKAWHIL